MLADHTQDTKGKHVCAQLPASEAASLSYTTRQSPASGSGHSWKKQSKPPSPQGLWAQDTRVLRNANCPLRPPVDRWKQERGPRPGQARCHCHRAGRVHVLTHGHRSVHVLQLQHLTLAGLLKDFSVILRPCSPQSDTCCHGANTSSQLPAVGLQLPEYRHGTNMDEHAGTHGQGPL